MSEIKFLKPFTRFCMTIGNLPSSYLVSMTYEEQLLWLCDYLEKTVIPTINNNSEVTKEIQELFNQLKNYVEHYFDNLDVQEEINNKLDEMAQDGTLNTILNNYDILYVIAPKFNSDEISSNYTILKNQNKCVLIDSSYSDNWYRLKEMLDTYNIQHLDAFILSHYDLDHAGNFNNEKLMIDGYIDSNTKLFLPPPNNTITESKILSIKNICDKYNLTYNTPTEGEIYKFGNTNIKFTNCDTAQINAFYSPSTDSNLYCTMCLVEHKNDKLLFTADCDNKSFELMKLNKIINRYY